MKKVADSQLLTREDAGRMRRNFRSGPTCTPELDQLLNILSTPLCILPIDYTSDIE